MTRSISFMSSFIKPRVIINTGIHIRLYIAICTIVILCAYAACSRVNRPALVAFGFLSATTNADNYNGKKCNYSIHNTKFVTKSKGF